jgi:hypothetical protein
MTEKARIVLNFEEKREIKDCFRNVTSKYIALWEEEKLLLDNTDDIYQYENILCDSNVNDYKYFRRFIAYLLGSDMTLTPKELYWDLNMGYKASIVCNLRFHLTNELFIKINNHIDAFRNY